MHSIASILSGVAGIALIAGAAAPAAAQSSAYGYNQGYDQSGGVVGAVINSVLGGGRYGAYGQGQDRVAVDRCARTAEAQVSRDYRRRGYGNAPQGYPTQGYANPYGQQGYNQANLARVIGITAVERRRNGVKVSGVIDSGMNRYRGAYGQAYGNQGYPNQGYANQGYPNTAYPNQGYGNPYAQSTVADLRFSCRVDYRGYVSNVEINRNVVQRRGY